MAGSVLGTRVIRKEDPKFITTGGVYLDDLRGVPELDGKAFVAYVRSSVAHGVVTSIDTSGATAIDGVLGVFTASDLGLEPDAAAFNPGVARPLLASERVRFVGDEQLERRGDPDHFYFGLVDGPRNALLGIFDVPAPGAPDPLMIDWHTTSNEGAVAFDGVHVHSSSEPCLEDPEAYPISCLAVSTTDFRLKLSCGGGSDEVKS